MGITASSRHHEKHYGLEPNVTLILDEDWIPLRQIYAKRTLQYNHDRGDREFVYIINDVEKYLKYWETRIKYMHKEFTNEMAVMERG